MTLTLTQQGTNFLRQTGASIDATGTNSSEEVEVSTYKNISVQVVHAAHTAGVTIWELQTTHDGTNWDSIEGSQTTTSGSGGSDTVSVNDLNAWKLRVTITTANGTDSAPTLTPFFKSMKDWR